MQFSSTIISITPLQAPSFSAELTGKKMLNSGKRMKMRQLPFVPTFASTTYKVQGITADGLVAFPFIAGKPIWLPFAAHYVALSRVRSFKTLFLCEAIGEEHVRSFEPLLEIIEEDIRLQELHNKTIRMWNRNR